MKEIILGSASLRRQELLAKIGVKFKVAVSGIDEMIDEKNPLKCVRRLAYLKGMDVLSTNTDALVLTADTIVELNGKILGKPKDEKDAFLMLKNLSGKTHRVITAVFIGTKTEYELFHEETFVTVNKMSDSEIANYITKENVYDKAGSYAIQGDFGKHVSYIKGDYYNVVGLPLARVYEILKKKGIINA
ncbi:MAG: Maf family protein [Bacilli bacterium]